MTLSSPILEAADLFCGYGKNAVLRQISFSVQKGQIIAVIGPNGCGKTTLLKTLSRVLPPIQGRVLINGTQIQQIPRNILARTLARMSQTLDAPPMTVGQYVLMGRLPYFSRYQFFEQARDLEKAEQTLELLGIHRLWDTPMAGISGGQRQLAAMARALVQEPDLLLLDEPTSHLDITHQAVILKQIRERNQKSGLTVIMVLHDLNLASEYAHHLILLHGTDGTIFRAGPPEQVITPAVIEAVYHTPVLVQQHPVSGKPYILTT
jgi:iron complex transport system ATP-binding protein